jgi:hypothetical protein
MIACDPAPATVAALLTATKEKAMNGRQSSVRVDGGAIVSRQGGLSICREPPTNVRPFSVIEIVAKIFSVAGAGGTVTAIGASAQECAVIDIDYCPARIRRAAKMKKGRADAVWIRGT